MSVFTQFAQNIFVQCIDWRESYSYKDKAVKCAVLFGFFIFLSSVLKEKFKEKHNSDNFEFMSKNTKNLFVIKLVHRYQKEGEMMS